MSNSIIYIQSSEFPISISINYLAAKMKLIHAITGQLLTFVTIRDVIEDGYDSWKNTLKEWREFSRAERNREREEATAR